LSLLVATGRGFATSPSVYEAKRLPKPRSEVRNKSALCAIDGNWKDAKNRAAQRINNSLCIFDFCINHMYT
jgi:hypothetical protein